MKKPDAMTMHHKDEIYTVASLENVVVIFWQRTPEKERLRRIEKLFDRIGRDYPAGYCVFLFVDSNSGLPTREVRSSMSTFLGDQGDIILGSSTLILGDGIFKSLLRTWIRAIFAITGRGRVNHFATSVTDGTVWIAEKTRWPPEKAATLLSAAEYIIALNQQEHR